MKRYLELFRRVALEVGPSLEARQLEIRIGTWHDSAVLKLQKRRWAEDAPKAAPTDAGIFFSIWVEEKSLRKNRMFYNVHALRLRELTGYSIQSREFAEAFRGRFARSRGSWPNVSVEYGPQTLMQGWVDLEGAQVEADVARLVNAFVPLSETIDHLLDQRKRADRDVDAATKKGRSKPEKR